MNKILIGVFVLIFPSITLASDSSESQWRLIKNKQGIKVFSSSMRDSDLQKIKGKFTVKSTLSAFVNVLNDLERVPEWLSNAETISIIKSNSNINTVVHTKFNALLFVSNRDMVVESTYHQDPDTYVVTLSINDLSEKYPRTPRYVRMNNVNGIWTIKPTLLNGSSAVSVTYEGTADPAGKIPTWIKDKVALSSTYQSLKALKKQMQLSEYQQPVAFIKEK